MTYDADLDNSNIQNIYLSFSLKVSVCTQRQNLHIQMLYLNH